MLRLGCLLVLALLIAIPAVASRYLPWWGTLLVIVGEFAGLVLLGPTLVKYGVKRFAIGLFATKSRVLRDAMVAVHRVEATARPAREGTDEADESGEDEDEDEDEGEREGEGEDDDEEDEGPRNYVLVDFTLTPKPGQSRMQHYEPSELMLVPFDQKVSMDEADDPTDADAASAGVERLWLVDESGGETDDFDKITGPAHLRVVFECPLSLTGRAKFRYYFETFGDLVLPPPAA
jgi:hypothetical protein